jgi:hypothetical protein
MRGWVLGVGYEGGGLARLYMSVIRTEWICSKGLTDRWVDEVQSQAPHASLVGGR